MEIPIQFPRPADVIAEQALRYRRLSVAEQSREFAKVLETGFQQLRSHPRRAAIEAQILESELQWQEAQLRRVFSDISGDLNDTTS